MKKLSIVIALAMSAGTALAADLPSSMKDSYAPAAAVSEWGGLYVGAFAGYGWGQWEGTRNVGRSAGVFTQSTCSPVVTPKVAAETTDEPVIGLSKDECEAKGEGWAYTAPYKSPDGYTDGRFDAVVASEAYASAHKFDMDGFFGGLEVSYKFRVGNSLILEPFADVSFGNAKGSAAWQRNIDTINVLGKDYDISDVGLTETGAFSVEKNWGGTAGIKLGGLVTQRNYIYVLAGAAYGNFDIKGGSALSIGDYQDEAGVFTTSYSKSDSAWGYTLGAGWEHALTNRLHFGVEGRYTAFSDIGAKSDTKVDYTDGICGEIKTGGCSVSTSDGINGDFDEWSIRGRITYRLTD